MDPIYEALSRSNALRKCRNDFYALTGLELRLLPSGAEITGEIPAKPLNGFCALMRNSRSANAKCTKSCAVLLRRLEKKMKPQCIRCHAGLVEAAVPVMSDARHVATLIAGRVLSRAPSEVNVDFIVKKLVPDGLTPSHGELLVAYCRTPVLEQKRLHSALELLAWCAELLEASAQRIVIGTQAGDPRIVQLAKEYARTCTAHGCLTRPAARHIGICPDHFDHVFKRSTGITYTRYVTRVRVERAKVLLVYPAKRVLDIAEEVGFNSLSQFNRAFKQCTGMTPSGFVRRCAFRD